MLLDLIRGVKCDPRIASFLLFFTDLGLDLAPGPGAAATVHDLEAAAITGYNFNLIII